MDERVDETWFILSKLLAVAGVDGDIREGCSAVVLYIDIGRSEELDKHGDGTRVHKLLSILVCERLVKMIVHNAVDNLPECVIFSNAPVAFR